VADQTANVIACSAGVSVVSGGFAAALASRATTPLSKNPWFMLCIVIAIISFIVLLLAGVRLAWTWWHDRYEAAAATPIAPAPEAEAPPVTTEQLEPGVSIPAAQASLEPADSLLLTVDENEKWDLWRRAGYICALLLTITNTTNQPITVVNYGIGTDWQRGPDDAPVEISREDRVSLRDEARARERSNYYGAPLTSRSWLRRKPRWVIPPHGHVSGWLVTDCPRPWTGGKPRCTIKVTDALGNTYTKVIKQRDPQHRES
jgi:hypothetical protein